MAPSVITEDYYMILEVEQGAPSQSIVSSYRRLALKLHPDRNAKHDATEAFQRLGRAYETLKDESKRRAYDLIYPSIRRKCPPHSTHIPRPPPTSASQPDATGEAAQIAAIQKLQQERSARWRAKQTVFDSTIFELRRRIRRLELEIQNLASILAAEAAAEASKNSWGSWMLSPLYRKPVESEEEKERKDRARQERTIEKDMKERRLATARADLKTQENLLNKAKEEVEAADRVDDEKIRVIQARKWAREYQEMQEKRRQEREKEAKERQAREREKREREAKERLAREREKREKEEKERLAREKEIKEILARAKEFRERQEREKALRERLAREWQERQMRERMQQERERQERERRDRERREASEATRKQQPNKRTEKQTRKDANKVQQGQTHSPNGGPKQIPTPACRHEGWWPKVQGRTACPECYDTWTYLLECPGCMMKACPKCQAAIRPRMPRNAAKMKRTAPHG